MTHFGERKNEKTENCCAVRGDTKVPSPKKYFLSIFDSLDNPRKDVLCKFYIEHGEYKKAAVTYKEMADTLSSCGISIGTDVQAWGSEQAVYAGL